MIKVNLSWLQQVLTDAEVYNLSSQQQQQDIDYVVTDSRTIKPGQVFVALKGESFDGSKFVKQVAEKGAIAVVVHEKQDIDIPQFVVADTLRAYGKIASAIAIESGVKTIGITGSSGKSTVKEMCAAILAQRGKVIATEGNFNNEIGVPHTLMRFEPSYDFAVVELGANHVGEIAYTQSLTKPDVAVLNNVAEAHLEGFGGIHGVVKAKGEIFQGLQKANQTPTRNGVVNTAVVNADSEYKDAWLPKLAEVNTLQFSLDKNLAGQDNFLVATDVEIDDIGCASFTLVHGESKTEIALCLPGYHNVANALAASAACLAIGAEYSDIKAGLASMQAVKGRVNLYKVDDQLTFIDDTYNANVGSIRAATSLLANYKGNRILVLGDMAELGDESEYYHRQVGEFAKVQEIDHLFACGQFATYTCEGFAGKGKSFAEQSELIAALTEVINNVSESTTLLFKGSRSSRMEQVFQALFERFNNNHNKG